MLKLPADSCHGLPGSSIVPAAFHTETALLCCPPWNSRRGIFQLGKRSGNGSPVWPGSHILCNSPPMQSAPQKPWNWVKSREP